MKCRYLSVVIVKEEGKPAGIYLSLCCYWRSQYWNALFCFTLCCCFLQSLFFV